MYIRAREDFFVILLSCSVTGGKIMSFYEWMIGKYLHKDTWRGDLARDMECDADFPKMGTRSEILCHLKNKNACDDCVEVFKRCWRDYARAGC